jgi:hypothetical protein
MYRVHCTEATNHLIHRIPASLDIAKEFEWPELYHLAISSEVHRMGVGVGLRQAAVAPTVRVQCRRVHDTHIMSTWGAHYVVTYKGGHGAAVATLRVGWVEAGGIGGINSVGGHDTASPCTRYSHNEHQRCSLCRSCAKEGMGRGWRRWNV